MEAAWLHAMVGTASARAALFSVLLCHASCAHETTKHVAGYAHGIALNLTFCWQACCMPSSLIPLWLAWCSLTVLPLAFRLGKLVDLPPPPHACCW